MRNLLVTLTVGLAVCSCVPTTPQARIQQSPAVFAALSPKEQQLVQQGALAKGMSQNAVLLAWGAPSMRYEGFRNGCSALRWDYTAASPVYTSTFFGGYSYGGYGHHGPYGSPYRGYGYGIGFAPEIGYLPYHKSSVWFVNNRVDAWERLR
ncbi:MAG: hypothetical protein WCP45_18550 [Verrucomicrobiota bacterium]